MASELDVVNLAIGYLNFETITGLEAPVPIAAAARNAWPVCRAAFLQEYAWSFAKRVVALPLRTGEPAAWNYMYGVPEDFHTCYRVFQKENRDLPGTLPYEINLDPDGHSRVLLCDYDEVCLEYGSTRPALGVFSPLAVEAVSYRLAFALCQMLKHDPNEQQTLYQTYMTILKAAIASDAGARSYPPLTADRYGQSRRRGIIPALARRPHPRQRRETREDSE